MATKQYNKQSFNYAGSDGFNAVFTAYTTHTKSGFCHTVKLYWYDGRDFEITTDTKTSYYNRTWERFDYETTLIKAIAKLPSKQQKNVYSVIIDGKAQEEIESADRIYKMFCALQSITA